MADLKKIAEDLINLTSSEQNKLSEIIRNFYGLEIPTVLNEIESKPDKRKRKRFEKFDVYLKYTGPLKLQVLKTVKEFKGIGLKEAKDIIDNAPCLIADNISKEKAEEIKRKLEFNGATVDLK